MTTYDGRSANFIPGRDVPNREPPVSKFVIERLYRVHRERLANVQPTIDSHAHIPDFLVNREWKRNYEKEKKRAILRENEAMARRMEIVRQSGSFVKGDNDGHIAFAEAQRRHFLRLREVDRQTIKKKIDKGNEHLLSRIENVKPIYCSKETRSWYKHHQNYKKTRRSDPTAGHLMPNLDGLLPKRNLPPLKGRYLDEDESSLNASVTSLQSLQRSLDSRRTSTSLSTEYSYSTHDPYPLLRLTMNSDLLTNIPRDTGSTYDSPSLSLNGNEDDSSLWGNFSICSNDEEEGILPNSLNPIEKTTNKKSSTVVADSQFFCKPSTPQKENIISSNEETTINHPHNDHHHPLSNHGWRIDSPQLYHISPIGEKSRSPGINFPKGRSRAPSMDFTYYSRSRTQSRNGNEGSPMSNAMLASLESLKKTSLWTENSAEQFKAQNELVMSRPFIVPSLVTNCVIDVYRTIREPISLTFRLFKATDRENSVATRTFSLEEANLMIENVSESANITYSMDNDDLETLSTLLINMFRNADKSSVGFLRYEDFKELMELIDLGISSQELRFVMSEADENENGVVDFEEFVPLAVDLILSFRARNRAGFIVNKEIAQMDEHLIHSLTSGNLQKVAERCVAVCQEEDNTRSGSLRIGIFKKVLRSISSEIGLTEADIRALQHFLPQNHYHRIQYSLPQPSFFDVLCRVQFLSYKRAMIMNKGSSLQRYLLELCEEEERRMTSYQGPLEEFVSSGELPSHSIICLLSNSPRLSLSRLQVFVIMNEASNLEDGMIMYLQFIPLVAKTIELMFEPKALRQRAELIEKTDLSTKALLRGFKKTPFDDEEVLTGDGETTVKQFDHRLLTLFRSYDIDHNGLIDLSEFLACLEALDLHLSVTECKALMAAADRKKTGYLQVEDFAYFFHTHLLELEREKCLRVFMSALQESDKLTLPAVDSSSNSKLKHSSTFHLNHSQSWTKDRANLMELFNDIIELFDLDETGFISFSDFLVILHRLDLSMNSTVRSYLQSSFKVTPDGRLRYGECSDEIASLIRVLMAKENALWARHQIVEDLETEAELEVGKEIVELRNIARNILSKSSEMEVFQLSPQMAFQEMHRFLFSTMSGLRREEAQFVCLTLFLPYVGDALNQRRNSLSNTNSASVMWQQNYQLQCEAAQSNLEDEEMNTTTSLAYVVENSAASIPFTGQSVCSPIAIARQVEKLSSIFQSQTQSKSQSVYFTNQEVTDAVISARRWMIHRALLLKKLERADDFANLPEILSVKQFTGNKNFVPFDTTLKLLESNPAVMKNIGLSGLIWLLSWEEGFDHEGSGIDMPRFTEYVVDIIRHLDNAIQVEHTVTAWNTNSSTLSEMEIADILNESLHRRCCATNARSMSRQSFFQDDLPSFDNSLRASGSGYIQPILDFSLPVESPKTVVRKLAGIKIRKSFEIPKDITKQMLEDVLRSAVLLKLASGSIDFICKTIFNSVNNTAINSAEVSPSSSPAGSVPSAASVPSIPWSDVVNRIVALIRGQRLRQLRRGRSSTLILGSGLSSQLLTPIAAANNRLAEELVKEVNSVVDRLMSFIRVRAHGMNLSIYFPSDCSSEHTNFVVNDSVHLTQSTKPIVLFKNVVTLPVVKKKVLVSPLPAVDLDPILFPVLTTEHTTHSEKRNLTQDELLLLNISPSPINTGTMSPNLKSRHPSVDASDPISSRKMNSARDFWVLETSQEWIHVHLTIHAIREAAQIGTCYLLATLISPDGSVYLKEPLPVRLSSLGVVDDEVAIEFARNLVQRMYLTNQLTSSVLQLEMVSE